jgi:hypothetical protein
MTFHFFPLLSGSASRCDSDSEDRNTHACHILPAIASYIILTPACPDKLILEVSRHLIPGRLSYTSLQVYSYLPVARSYFLWRVVKLFVTCMCIFESYSTSELSADSYSLCLRRLLTSRIIFLKSSFLNLLSPCSSHSSYMY